MPIRIVLKKIQSTPSFFHRTEKISEKLTRISEQKKTGQFFQNRRR